MRSFSWLRGGKRSAKLKNLPPSRRRKTSRLAVEQLETRAMLATFIVNTTTDNAADLAGTVDGQLSLREAITAANTNARFGDAVAGSSRGTDIIRFDATLSGQTITLGNGQFTITDALTIDGQALDVAIDAVAASRVFNVNTSKSVTLSNLTLENGDVTGDGGAIAFLGGGSKFLNGMTILNSDAGGQGGGAIFNASSTLTIRNSRFSGNAADGAAGSGGAILTQAGSVFIYDTEISGNVANRAGGGIEIVRGTMRLERVTLGGDTVAEGNIAGPTGSAAPGNGGGLHVTGTTSGTRITLVGGSVQNNVAALEGGGLWNQSGSTLDITGTLIADNTAQGDAADDGGGGIFNNGGTVLVRNATIDDNTADGTAGSGGGIFSTAGTVDINGGIISGNVANRAGGGIEIITGILRLRNVTLGGASAAEGNVAGPVGTATPGNGGGIHVTGSGARTSITGGSVLNNVARLEGGGLWNATGSTMELSGVTVSNNIAAGAAADDGGGGIFNNGGTLFVRTSTIANNQATGTAGSGGGVFTTNGLVEISSSTISGNVANRAGGGIEVITGTVRVRTTNLGGSTAGSGNVAGPAGSAAPGNGGGLHVTGTGARVTITGGRVQNNVAALEGGGLWNAVGSTLEVFSAVVTGNHAAGTGADDGGGGIFDNGGMLTIYNSDITNNTTAGRGGGLFIREGTNANVRLSSINGNTAADDGGGIFNDGLITLVDSEVTGNHAAGDGGGIYTDAGDTTTLDNTPVTGNTADGADDDLGGPGTVIVV